MSRRDHLEGVPLGAPREVQSVSASTCDTRAWKWSQIPVPGGARGARTPDLLHAMQALFQLSYGPAPWYRAYAVGRE